MLLTKEEIETPRTAAKIRCWAEQKIEYLGNTKEGKHAIRFREGYAKELTEETLPLGIFCENYFKSSRYVVIQQHVGNQNYDATIKDKRLKKSPIKYLEITQAHEGEDAHLRMLHLENKGHANVLGMVTKKGTKHTGITVEIENEALEHGVVVDNELQRILEAARRKSGKEYPDNTGLVIICDDYIVFREQEDIEKLIQFIHENVLEYLNNFLKVFVIGWSSKTYLEFK